MEDKFEQAYELMKNAKKIVCISHKRPDGDTIGAAVAVYHILKNMGKEHVDLGCVDEPSDRFTFLPGVEKYIKDVKKKTVYSLYVSGKLNLVSGAARCGRSVVTRECSKE